MSYFPPQGSTVSYQITPSSLLVGASIFGLPPVNITNTNLNVGGSVVAFEGAGWSGSVAAQLIGANTVSVVGNVGQTGTVISSLVSTIPSSVIVGTSIFGQLPAGTAPIGSIATLQGTVPWIISSVYGNISGSVVATISGTPNVNTAGSVVAFQGTSPWVVQSIVGTYAEDAGHTTATSGLFTLGVRNDAVASFVSANLDYTPIGVDSAGRTVVKLFVPEDGTIISYQGSVVSGSVTLIQASAIGLRNYITDFWVANTGSVSTLITFQDGSTSILGRTIAPAGGGSNSPGIAVPLKTAPSQDLAFTAGTNTSVLYMTVKGYQSP